MVFRLLPGMQLGVSSAPAQIEGGDVDHNWNHWYRLGKIKDGSSPGRANRHLELWREDIDLMHSMGIRHYRLGIEWARLEPEEGSWDKEAVRYYRKLLKYMKKRGIEPLLTLHHFTNPMWFESQGGFADEQNISAFLRYVSFAVRAFGDLVAEYITVNEPNVYATLGYYDGGFPPGEDSVMLASKVMSVMAACHIRSYRITGSAGKWAIMTQKSVMHITPGFLLRPTGKTLCILVLRRSAGGCFKEPLPKHA